MGTRIKIVLDMCRSIWKKSISKRAYIRFKEWKLYNCFIKSFGKDYWSDYTITTDSECLYRCTYYNNRNKELVDMCRHNDIEGIARWYSNSDEDKMYFDEYYDNRMSMRIIAKHIINTISKDSFIIDVACGHGSIDKYLSLKGFKVKGIDLNQNRIDGLKADIYETECIDVDKLNNQQKYDVIISLEMLEHVPNVLHTLTKMNALLVENGMLYLSVPNEDMIDDEQHVRIFSRKSIIKLLEQTGFSIMTVITLPYLNHESKNDLVCVCKKG